MEVPAVLGGRIMKVSRPCSGFHRMTDERYSDTICAVCGRGIQQGEDTARDQNGKICHAACVEKEDGYGAKFAGGYFDR